MIVPNIWGNGPFIEVLRPIDRSKLVKVQDLHRSAELWNRVPEQLLGAHADLFCNTWFVDTCRSQPEIRKSDLAWGTACTLW